MGDLGVQIANSKDGAAKALEQDLVEIDRAACPGPPLA